MQCRSRIRTGDVSLNRRSKPLPHRCLAMFSDSIGFSVPPIQLLKFDLLCSFVDATASGMRRVNKRALGLLSTKALKIGYILPDPYLLAHPPNVSASIR